MRTEAKKSLFKSTTFQWLSGECPSVAYGKRGFSLNAVDDQSDAVIYPFELARVIFPPP